MFIGDIYYVGPFKLMFNTHIPSLYVAKKEDINLWVSHYKYIIFIIIFTTTQFFRLDIVGKLSQRRLVKDHFNYRLKFNFTV